MSSRRESVFRAAALERLSSPEQLDERMRVVSPRAWLALAALGALLLAVVLWGAFGHLPVKTYGVGHFTGAQAIVFVPAADVRRIQPGMTAQLFAATRAGPLSGRVESVSERPARRAELLEALGDEAPARRLAAAGAFAVRINAADASVPAGVPCHASIVVADERPIALVFPALARAFAP